MAAKTVKKTVTATENTQDAVVEEKKAAVPEKKPAVQEVDLHDIVTVRNGFQGRLVYVSRKTGETYIWEHFGDEQDMEIGELRNARSSAKAFYENNWFMFDDPWIVEYLGVTKYYAHAVKIEDFDDIFTMDPADVEKTVEGMTSGQKRSLTYRAQNLIADGEIDSNKVIAALEKSLGVPLVEHGGA